MRSDSFIRLALVYSVFFFFEWYGDHRDLHSFPTRRSSDLEMGADCVQKLRGMFAFALWDDRRQSLLIAIIPKRERSEEHTSELQSQFHLVCRLLLEKKKKNKPNDYINY